MLAGTQQKTKNRKPSNNLTTPHYEGYDRLTGTRGMAAVYRNEWPPCARSGFGYGNLTNGGGRLTNGDSPGIWCPCIAHSSRHCRIKARACQCGWRGGVCRCLKPHQTFTGSGGICTYLESEVRPSHWLVSFTCIIIHLKLLSSLANFYTIICRSLPYRDIVHCNGGW